MKQPIVIAALTFAGVLFLGSVLFIAPQFLSQNNKTTPDERDYLNETPTAVSPVDDTQFEEPVDVPVIDAGVVIDSFEDCAAAGYPVMESYPEQCRAHGVLFVREITEPVGCTMDVKLCADGTSVGRTGPNCEFAPCPGGELTPEDDVFQCSKEERATQICTREYMPVCGLVEECDGITCSASEQTFGNSCSACSSGVVTTYTVGECAMN